MSDAVLPDILLSRQQVAEILGVAVQTLAVWSLTGRYQLPVVKCGRLCRYRRSDVERFIASRTIGGDAQ